MTFKIRVTLEDIKNGKQRDNANCPIALALKRELYREDIAVDYDILKIGSFSFYTSHEIKDFQLAFDAGKEVKPFIFDFDKLRFCEEYTILYEEPHITS